MLCDINKKSLFYAYNRVATKPGIWFWQLNFEQKSLKNLESKTIFT